MNQETVKDICTPVKHASTCCAPAAWPPPWLAETAEESSPPPLPTVAETSKPAAPAVASDPLPTVPQDDDQEVITPPPPCPKCGSLDLWQTVAGNWRCEHCDIAAWRRSRSLLERAERLRRIVTTVPGVKLATEAGERVLARKRT